MSPEVREIHDALIRRDTIYDNAKAAYEAMRARIVREHGYDKFREWQKEAFNEIVESEKEYDRCMACGVALHTGECGSGSKTEVRRPW